MNFMAAVKTISIIKIMERWGEWVLSDRREYRQALGIPISSIGRAQQFSNHVKCPACKGEGSHIVEIKKQMLREDCRTCGGAGSVLLKPIAIKQQRKCPHCKDDFGVSRGEKSGRTCLHCRGAGVIEHQTPGNKIVPAFIRAEGQRRDPDDISPRVDRLVCALPHIQKEVVMQEYLRVGRREDKAHRISHAYGIEFGWRRYQTALNESLETIEAGLQK